MRVWTNNSFSGHWPVGTAAVVVAETAELAARQLNDTLAKVGLQQPPIAASDMLEVLTDVPAVRVLCDGDY